MRKFIVRCLPFSDYFLFPFVLIAAWLVKLVRRVGTSKMPACHSALLKIGVFPILDHYYEPQFRFDELRQPLSDERALPGIDWNMDGQLELLSRFTYGAELANLPHDKPETLDFFMNNSSFGPGDAEFWYQIVRTVKPRRIFEVGSGHSTLMAIRAVKQNKAESADYTCRHVCIEPYEMAWLEQAGIDVHRKKVEDVDPAFFAELQENDILFIDSSHIIHPQGDVLCEYLDILPRLNKGVIVHVHDIFTPRNYPHAWVVDDVKFWNEQYILEAFLTHNHDWKVIGAVNMLRNRHYDALKGAAPYLTEERQPGSFYIQKIA